jgi:hypothetical protein
VSKNGLTDVLRQKIPPFEKQNPPQPSVLCGFSAKSSFSRCILHGACPTHHGSTVKLFLLVVMPPALVTEIVPLLAPAGTVAVMYPEVSTT